MPYSTVVSGKMSWQAQMEESLSLCSSLGCWHVVDALALRKRAGRTQKWGQGRNRALWLRPGQVDSVKQAATAADCELVFINTSLSPTQTRNLSDRLQLPVVDRFALILQIFQTNASTKEAQVCVVDFDTVQIQLQRFSARWCSCRWDWLLPCMSELD